MDFEDICRRKAGLCKQEPNLAPIQRERERVISWRQPIEQAVKMQNRNNYKQQNIDLFFY